MWQEMDDGKRRFLYGKDAPQKAVEAARECARFRPDDEEEQINDDPVSCYNCRTGAGPGTVLIV
jgi:hypothetical protein